MHDYLNHTLSTCGYTSEQNKQVSKFLLERMTGNFKETHLPKWIKCEYIATASSPCVVSEPDPSREEEGSGHVSTFELSLWNFFSFYKRLCHMVTKGNMNSILC